MVAAALQERTGFVRLSSDVVRKEIAGPAAAAAQPSEYEAGLYSRERSAATYATMLARASGEIAAGRGVILDATFQRRADRDALRALAAGRRVPLLFVECRCSEDEVRRRLEERGRRGGGESDADWSVYLEQCKRYEAFAADERDDTLAVDTEPGGRQVTQAVEGALRRRMRDAACAAPPTS